MQFGNFITVFGLAALAAAAPQEATGSSSVSPSMTISSAPVSPTTVCITNCGSDICCQARCVGVPCPDEAAVNATTQCAMKCDQGSGSAEDTAAYAACQSACIKSNFLSATGTPAATGTNTLAPSNSASATGSAEGDSQDSASSTASSTDSAASASSSGAATSNKIGTATAGILGLLMAALAL